jgi:hypothetical protein
MAFYKKIRDIDRRYIFLVMALAVGIPIIFRIPFPEITTPLVQGVFDKIDSLPAGTKVLLAFDYDPTGEAELQPMANSIVRQLALRKCRLYFIALWPAGQNMIEDTLKNILIPEYPQYIYGSDYVNLGYKSGNEAVIKVIQTNLRKLYTTDTRGTSIDKIPMMQDLNSLKNFGIIVNISSGYPGLKEWIQFGSDPADLPIVGGCTAVQATIMYPYYPNQLLGILGGIKGAAEYDEALKSKYAEQLGQNYTAALERQRSAELEKLGKSYKGRELQMQTAEIELKYKQKLDSQQEILYLGLLRMGPQAIAHLFIMLLIVIGNITFFIERSRQKNNAH